VPVGWRWSPGKAQATLVCDETVARSGRRSVKLVNPTPRSPHVYSQLITGVRVNRGNTYTLSCYVKSAAPGTAWIGTGKKWQHRFHFPPAADWKRVVGTFEADDDRLELRILTESPTEGLWVDDVQLEPGEHATTYIFPQPVEPGAAALRVFQGEMVALAPNLVSNSSFEIVDGVRPKFWMWDQRNTDATMTIDETVRRSGDRSLKFTNGTKFGPHVYGWLGHVGDIPVKPETTYTLSCYVRSEDPGIAWLGGGTRWWMRMRLPKTEGAWKRVEKTFQTKRGETKFPLMLVTESPTKGFWVDDIKLEQGQVASFYLPERTGGRTQVALEVPQEISSGKVLELGGWVYAPRELPGATLAATVSRPDGQALARAQWTGDLGAGTAWAQLRWGVTSKEAGPCRLKVALRDAQGREVAAGEQAFTLHTAGQQAERLARLRQALPALKRDLKKLRAQQIDDAYPLVGLTVIENFCDFIADDLQHEEVVRAARQLTELEQMLQRTQTEVANLLAGRRQALPVPRYQTGRIEIDGGSFVADVKWPDGRTERRPVFFSGYGHFRCVRRDVEKFPAYGLNIFQVEFGPNSTIVAEDRVDLGACQAFESVLDRAEKSNVAVNLLLSPHYFPQWALKKWPELGGVKGGFLKYSIDAPESRAIEERFLRTVIPRLKGRPGMHSYCLSNEPIYLDARQDPHNQAKWIAWLKNKYGTLARLNEAHRAKYAAWEQAPMPPPRPAKAEPAYYDWCKFNNERFAAWHRWMADIIHQIDPRAPVHAKIMNTVFNRDHAAYGVDPELFCDLSQIAGNDCCKWYSHREDTWASGWQGENMFFDLLRSCRGQPIFNSENHVIIDRDQERVPAVHIRNIMWQAAVHGQGASTMWVWERTFDPHSSLAGSIMHRPACAEAHGRTALDLMRLAPQVTALQRAPARVALVYSIASLIYNSEYPRLLSQVYRALNFTGEKIDFITERQLAAGKARQYRMIFAPGVTHLPADALRGLVRFAERGTVVTKGEGCLAHDDLDRPAPTADMAKPIQLPDEEDEALREAVVKALAAAGLQRTVIVQEAETGREPWGVEWLSATVDGRTLVNLVNYLQKPQRVKVVGLARPVTDLFTGAPAPEVLDLAPLEPALLSSRR